MDAVRARIPVGDDVKAEVLAEWRTRLADRTLITLPAGAVERLLDERLKLLEALWLMVRAEQDRFVPDWVREALAFAQKP